MSKVEAVLLLRRKVAWSCQTFAVVDFVGEATANMDILSIMAVFVQYLLTEV